MGIGEGIFNTFFNALCLRSSGLSTVSYAHAMPATLFALMIFMFIGASPSSTGGGIKTTTFALFVTTIYSIIKNKTEITVMGRTVPQSLIYKAICIIALGVLWIITITFLLLISEPQCSFINILFEATSAFSTCGVTTGTIREFSSIGKFIIMVSMLIGRIGSLTIVLTLYKKQDKQLFRYPEERIVIG